jgi:hypothetical protein
MKKTFKLFGTITLAAVVAFTMAACSSGGGDPDDAIPGLTKGNPPAKVLTDLGLPADIMDTLLDAARAADSDYLGYVYLPELKDLAFLWKNKKKANVDKMVDRLTEKLKPLTKDFYHPYYLDFISGNHGYSDDYEAEYKPDFFCYISLLSKSQTAVNGITYPEGTMAVEFIYYEP